MVGARILEAAQDGDVVLANAPGSGVADDKAMYCVVPDLISYYLDERPLLLPVPTYRCGRPEELGPVLQRLDQLVTKPVDGYGGGGVLSARRRPRRSSSSAGTRSSGIRADGSPRRSSRCRPTRRFDGTRLDPRHVDLRAFVYQSGTGPDEVHLADLALTRVAPPGSMVVNSSRGGGAKDTWIIVDGGEEPDNGSERQVR